MPKHKAMAEALIEKASRPLASTADAVNHCQFRREADYWTLSYNGHVSRLKDAKGLRYIACLLRHPRQKFHVYELSSMNGRYEASPVVRDLGDAGELLDARSKAEYRQRLDELKASLEEAERFNDIERAARLREELEFITAQLHAAVGLSGRDRRAASHLERARSAVTFAIKATLKRIGEANPALGRHLVRTIKTGYFCSYVPDPKRPNSWQL